MTELERTITQRLRQRAEKPLHEGSYWSDYDRDELRRMFDAGTGITEIALTLERSEQAVMQMIEKLDLFRRQQHPRRQKKQRRGCVPIQQSKTCRGELIIPGLMRILLA